jgi:hypothetical protein
MYEAKLAEADVRQRLSTLAFQAETLTWTTGFPYMIVVLGWAC